MTPSVPAAVLAAQRVAAVRDRPQDRWDLLRSSYAPAPGTAPPHRPYSRAALAFMGWQVRRGLLNPADHERPGSPWWRAVNERLLRDTCEARLAAPRPPGPGVVAQRRAVGAVRPGPDAAHVVPAHNVTIVRAYVDHRDLAEHENRVERFFLNLVLVRVLFAHALVAAPRLALAWLAPVGPWVGDPRRDATGRFLAVSRVLPDRYPLEGELDDYVAAEHLVGRLLDLGVITPRLDRALRLGGRRAAGPGARRPGQRQHADLRVGPRGPGPLVARTVASRAGGAARRTGTAPAGRERVTVQPPTRRRRRPRRNAAITMPTTVMIRFASTAGRQLTWPLLMTNAPAGRPVTPKPPPSPS